MVSAAIINSCVWKDYLSAQRSSIPHLPDVADVTDRVIRIMGGNPGEFQLQGTNTYLLGTGRKRILVDTGQGFPIWIATLTALLQSRNLEISHVLLTHWHGDHTGGVGDLISYDPTLAARIYKNQPDRGQQAIEDGQVFRTEGATVRAVFSPGHAVDHMCFVLEEENGLFTGDNVLGHGYSVVEDLGAYMKSLRYMEEQGCAVGYPAHGAKIEDLPRKMTQYIQHKEIREKQVYSTLVQNKGALSKSKRGKKSLTTRELVYFLHGEVSDDTFEMALEPFMTQVLWKLAEDGKIGFEMIGCHRRWFAHENIPQVQTLKC